MKSFKKSIYYLILSIYFFTSLYTPLSSNAQQKQGVNFIRLENWAAVLTTAKKENKPIFVDVFTTWCGPCKMMDTNVFSNPELGQLLNKDFIAVKIQMDSTKTDEQYVKSWYKDAVKLQQDANIAAFPTSLFYSPQGELIFKSIGYKDVNGITKLAKFASKPEINQQFQKEILAYQNGKRDIEKLSELSINVKELIGDRELALAIAKDYKTLYLDKLPFEKSISETNINFIGSNGGAKLLNSKDLYFKLAYEQPLFFDSIFKSPKAESYVFAVIRNEEITIQPRTNDIVKMKIPEWDLTEKRIWKKYPKIDVKKLMILAKRDYYFSIKDWNNYTKYRSEELEKYPLQEKSGLAIAMQLNEPAWQVFSSTGDKNALTRALKWSILSIQLLLPEANASFYDTQANLLYRLGRIEEAIKVEKKAVSILQKDLKTKELLVESEIWQTLEKMEKGLPTWN